MKIVLARDFEYKMQLYQKLKKDFKVRQSPNYQEILIGNENKIVFNQNNTFSKGLFLFSMVKRDFEKYLAKNGSVTPYDPLPVNCINENYNDRWETSGIDINNAYWSVAFLKDYISEKTYIKGLENKEYKPIRLSSLSSVGRDRSYKVYQSGSYKHTEVKKGNTSLTDMYLDIRYSTYGVMYEISLALKRDFKAWKTDCIYFRDNHENKIIVTEILDGYGLQWKLENEND